MISIFFCENFKLKLFDKVNELMFIMQIKSNNFAGNFEHKFIIIFVSISLS